MSSKIGTAILELRTDKTGFSSGLAGAKKDVAAFANEIGGLAGNAGTLLAGIGAGVGIGLGVAFKTFIDDASKIEDLSQRLKIPEETVQEWQAFFGQAGVDIEAVAKASDKLSINLIGGDKGAVNALKKMGLSIEELKAMKPEDRFNKVADAIGNLQDAGEKAYAAKTILGKGGVELLAALDGSLTASTQKMRDLGLVIDGETIKAADNFGDQLGFMGKQLLGIVATVVGPLLPALSALGNVLMWIGSNVVGPVLNVTIKAAMTLLAGFWEVLAKVLSEAAKLASHLPGVGGKFGELSAYLDASSKSAGQYMVGLWDKTEKVGQAADTTKPKLIGLGKDTEEAGKKAAETAAFYANLASSMDMLSGAQIEAIRYYKDQGKSVSEIAKALGIYEQQVEQVVSAEKLQVESTKHLIEYKKKQIEAEAEFLKARSEGTLENYKAANEAELEILKTTASSVEARTVIEIDGIKSVTAARIAGLDALAPGYAAAKAMLEDSMQQQIDDVERMSQIAKEAMKFEFVGPEPGAEWGNRFSVKFGDIVKHDIPDILQRAFEGGGGVMGAVKSLAAKIGGMIGGSKMAEGWSQDLTDKATSFLHIGQGKFASGLKNIFSGGISAAIDIGMQLISKGLEKLASKVKEWFGGPSQQEVEGRNAESSYETQLAGSLTATERLKVGTNQLAQAQYALAKSYMSAGMTEADAAKQAQADFDALLKAERLGGDAVKHVQDEIQARIDHAKAISDGIDGIVSAAQGAGGAVAESLRPMIQALIDSGKLTDDQKTKLQGLLDMGNDMQSIEDDAKKYGVTVDQLGAKFKQFDVMRDGDALGQFFQRAKRAGADLAGTISGISDETQTLVTQALKTGVSLPSSLKEVAEYLFNTGQLVDENGKKMTDFSRLSFEDAPIDKSSQAIVDAIDKLTQLFENLPGVAMNAANGIAGALDKIPNETHKKVIFDQSTNGGVNGGAPDLPVIPEAAGGTGRVLGPTLFYSAGNEDFAFSGEGRSFQSGGAASSEDLAGLRSDFAGLRRYIQTQLPADQARASRDAFARITQVRR